MSFYGADLAYIHDQGFGWLARGAAEVLIPLLELRRARPGSGPASHVVELGCGSGVLTELLCNAGCRVTALDYSADMLAIARQRAPAAEFVQGSIYDYVLPPCDAVCLVGEIVNYCAAVEPTLDMLGGLFAHIHAALAPGGVLLFDSAGPGRTQGRPPRGWVEGDGWAILYESSEDAGNQMLERRHTTFRREGDSGLYRRSSETHRLRLWPPEQVEALLGDTGFVSIERLAAYGSADLPPGLTGFLARA